MLGEETTDDRITYELCTENEEHYVIATAQLKRINSQKADGRDRLEAAEALCSLLIDLADVLFDDWEKVKRQRNTARGHATKYEQVAWDLRAENGRLREALEWLADHCRNKRNVNYDTCEDNCGWGRAEECPGGVPEVLAKGEDRDDQSV